MIGCDLFNMCSLSWISLMASLGILCSNPLSWKNEITKIEHKRIFCGLSKILKYISWPIHTCLTYFMTPQKPSSPPSYILNVWFLTSMTSTNKVESIQKRALRLLCNGCTSTYESLLAKANKPSMELKRYWTLALEIFKTLNFLNPKHMQDLFYLCSSFARRPNNIAAVRTNTSTYGTKSIRSLGP